MESSNIRPVTLIRILDKTLGELVERNLLRLDITSQKTSIKSCLQAYIRDIKYTPIEPRILVLRIPIRHYLPNQRFSPETKIPKNLAIFTCI